MGCRRKRGKLLIAASKRARQNRRTMEQQQPERAESETSVVSTNVVELRKLVDDRDATIRLLNEALCRALDELDRAAEAA